MNAARERDVAAGVARLVLDGTGAPPADEPEWVEFLNIAMSNGVALRALERLAARGIALPASVSTPVEAQRTRARQMFEAMSHVAELCSAHHVKWCYPKALQRLPDIGRDLDLLVEAGSSSLDALLRRELGAVRVNGRFGLGIAGSTQYRFRRWPTELDVQHGRLGIVGEHWGFPAELLRRCRTTEFAGQLFNVPRSEDQLVLQGLQVVYGRKAIRVTDVVSTIALVRTVALDWDDVLRASAESGTGPGLSCYLSYIDQVHVELFGTPLPCPPQARRRLIRTSWGRVTFTRGRYRFPVVSVNARLYLGRFVSDLASGRWASAGRLCLLPGIAAAAVGEWASQRLRAAPAATRSSTR